MGRAKYSEEMVNEITASFVTAAKEIIREEGIEAASIRRIAARAGYSSGTLYLYFEDLDELITMSLITYLNGYTHDLAATAREGETPSERYLRSWRLFCKHGLLHPREFLQLFYGFQTRSMNAIAKRYYELFPEELQDVDGIILSMLLRGSLKERNKTVLEPLAKELDFPAHDTTIINDLTVAYFYSYLLDASETQPDEEEVATWVDSFMEGIEFLIRKTSQ